MTNCNYTIQVDKFKAELEQLKCKNDKLIKEHEKN